MEKLLLVEFGAVVDDRWNFVDGLFICTERELQSIIGKDVEFGDVHYCAQDLIVTIEEKHIKIISEDQDKIQWLQHVFAGNTLSGKNPFDFELYNDED